MKIHVPEALFTASIIYTTLYAIERSSIVKSASREKRAIVKGSILFVVLFAANRLVFAFFASVPTMCKSLMLYF
jgi:hypothetical protein